MWATDNHQPLGGDLCKSCAGTKNVFKNFSQTLKTGNKAEPADYNTYFNRTVEKNSRHLILSHTHLVHQISGIQSNNDFILEPEGQQGH